MKSKYKSVYFLAAIIFLNLLARVIFSPLLLTIENDLGISRSQASGFFLFITLGYASTMLSSGFISAKLSHRSTILLSIISTGLALLLLSRNISLNCIRISLIFLGMSCGLYLPSGIAVITRLADSKNWGKAIAIHELGPNMSLIAAPFLVEVLLRFYPWRVIFLLLGFVFLVSGVLFAVLVKEGDFRDEPPNFENLGVILSKPSFWIITILLCLVIGSALGVYSVLPAYLVSDRAMERDFVNFLVGFSRISGLFMVFLSGWLVDRFGARFVLYATGLTVGLLTVLLGLTHGIILVLVVIIQPPLIAGFFPAVFAAVAQIVPARTRNVAVSLMIPIGNLIGGGVVPMAMGWLAERGAFAIGFIMIGAMLTGSIPLLFFLKLKE
ncbi:MAG: MFS transporter [Spirochaeta sp.]|nr:MFS transporter [Spirochaeta sp.]